jgi:hypothetical protein
LTPTLGVVRVDAENQNAYKFIIWQWLESLDRDKLSLYQNANAPETGKRRDYSNHRKDLGSASR